ncbi:MAG: T9SS type A sorting domain-containing protein [Bacteroidota bacterium]|jgi:hypothetical protein
MKRRYRFLVMVLVMATVTAVESQAQWVQSDCPYGGAFDNLAVNEKYVLANGFFYSSDMGSTWQATGFGRWSRCLAVADSNVFAGDLWGSVYVSTDYGLTWATAGTGKSGLPASVIYSLVAMPGWAGGNVIAGTDSGAYRSTDRGASWSAVNNGIAAYDQVASLMLDATYIFAGTQTGVYLSTDFGTTWKLVTYAGSKVCAFASVASYVYAGTVSSGVLRSTNYGKDWQPVNGGLTSNSVLCIAIGPAITGGYNVYAGTPDGVFVSGTTGSSWQALGLSGYTIQSLVTLGVEPLAATKFGIFRSTDLGLTWQPSSNGIPARVWALGSYGYKTLSLSSAGFCVSMDGGQSWSQSNTGLPDNSFSSLAINSSMIFVGSSVNGVYRASVSRMVWEADTIGMGPQAQVASIAASDARIFAGLNWWGGLYASCDNGGRWSAVQSNSLWNNHRSVYSIVLRDSLVVANTDGGVYVSSDNGVTWLVRALEKYRVNALAFGGQVLYAGTSSAGVFTSTDNGVSWSGGGTASGLTNTHVNCFATKGTNVFAGTNQGIFLSTDSGTSWSSVTVTNPALDSGGVYCLAIVNSQLLAVVSAGGVWRRPLSQMITDVPPSRRNIPLTYNLDQNYPNPFNPTTTVSFVIGHSSLVTLTVYDILGRQVATLVNEVKPPGEYTVRWNADGVPSGVYFYRLTARPTDGGQAGRFSDTKKLLLIN